MAKVAIFMSSLTRQRRYYKQLRRALEMPNPCRSYEDYLQLQNEDLSGMDRLELRNAWNAAEMALLLSDGDSVLYIDPQGALITERTYLLKRIAAIRRIWRGVTG